MVKPLGRHVQYSVTFAVAEDRFEPQPGTFIFQKLSHLKTSLYILSKLVECTLNK